jgi:undecaprenyl-diphosphatase
VPTLLGWPYAGVAFDVALHWGTLLALLLAFGGDWWTMARDLVQGPAEARSASASLLARLVVGSIPGAVVGFLLQDFVETRLRSLPLQAVMLFVFGALLWAVDRFRPPGRPQSTPGFGAAIGIGFAQALALVPGVSRSGITMTAGRAAGLDRVSAARFSFLLATPITFGAGILELRHLPHDLPIASLMVGVVVSAIVGILAIRGLLRWLASAGFGAFFIYRAALALLILFRLPHAG